MSLCTADARPLIVAVGLALAMAGVTSTAAQAVGQPDIQKAPPGEFSFVSDSCGFSVRADVRARQGMTKTFFDAAGVPRTIHLSGAFTGTLTHVSDGSDGPSLRINFSGPGSVDLATGDLSSRGPWLLEGPDDPDTLVFEGFMLLVRGRAEVSSDPVSGLPIVDSTTGNVVDLCAALA